MIQYNPKDWFGLIFKFHKSDTFRKLFWVILSLAGYSFLMAWVEIRWFNLDFKSTSALHSILGFVLSILLVFRTNTAYDRWWEGRRNWGALVNNSRGLAIKIKQMGDADDPLVKELFKLIRMYPQILVHHLRHRKAVEPEIPEHVVHQPNYVLSLITGLLVQLNREGKLTDYQLLMMNDELRGYSDICGACERIRNTPIPYSYSMFLKKFIFIYIITMPYGFIREFHYGITLVVTFVFYVLASLELIAEEIENPFGTDANDLNIDEIAAGISRNVYEIESAFPTDRKY